MSEWFGAEPDPGRLNLLCLPQAGGDTNLYRRWIRDRASGVAIVPALLPGRGRRWREPGYTDMAALADTLFAAAQPFIGLRYAILGSSMGAWLGHALCMRIEASGAPRPKALVAITAAPPGDVARVPDLAVLHPEARVAALRAFNPDFARVAAHPELVDMLLPVIMSDFALCLGYQPPIERLCTPVLAVAGADDALVSPGRMDGWRSVTAHRLRLLIVDGGHDLIEHPPPSLLFALEELATSQPVGEPGK